MTTPKFYALDAIRGLAAIFVLSRHSLDYWPAVVHRSYLAVDVFFLLSGFVIAHSYEAKLESGRLSTGTFLLVRVIRLYPMYLLTLLAALTLKGPTELPELTRSALQSLFMLPTVHEGMSFPLNAVYWSLFFELVVNVIYVVLRPILTTRVLAVAIFLLWMVLVFMERKVGGLDVGMKGTPFHFLAGTVRASFGILFGVLLYRKRRLIWPSIATASGPYAAIVVVCACLCFPDIGRFNWVVDALLVLLIFPICLMTASATTPKFGQSVMEALGTSSYPLYLMHPLLADVGVTIFSAGMLKANAPLSGVLFTVVVVLIALGVERFVDRPTRRALSRRFVRGARASTPAAG